MQVGIRHGTDARRIAQAHVLGLQCQIEIELTVVRRGVSAKVDHAATHVRRKSFYLQPVLIEYRGSVDPAQRARKIAVGDRAVGDLQPPLRRGFVDRASNRQVNGDFARSGEIRIKTLNELEICVTLGAQVEFAFTVQPDRAANRKSVPSPIRWNC